MLIDILILFEVFFKIGLFTFGGGYAMIPFIQQVVTEQGWMDANEMINFVAISEATPGPIGINMATYLGYKVAGLGGAISATIGVCLPSIIVIVMVAKIYQRFKESALVQNMMKGIKPAVVGLIAATIISIVKNTFDVSIEVLSMITVENTSKLIILVIAGFLVYKKNHPIMVISVSAILGIVINIAINIVKC